MLSIDIPTLAFGRGIMVIMLGGLLLMLGNRSPDDRAARWWAAGMLANGLSLLVFPLDVQDGWRQARNVFNHLSLGSSSILLLVGFRRFGRQRVRAWLIALLMAFPLLSIVAWELLWPHARLRVLCTASGQAVFLFALQWSLRQAPRAELAGIYRSLRWVVCAYLLIHVGSYVGIAGWLPTTALAPTDYHRSLFSIASLLFALSLAVACLALQFAELAARNADLAMLDWLTGLLNRRGLFRALDAAGGPGRAAHRPAYVLAMDVDRFKAVNDSHGHAVGDRVLQAAAQVLRSTAAPEDLVARIGGEEFLVVAERGGLDQARALAESIRRRCADARCRTPAGETIRFTVSLGVSRVASPDDLDAALRRADEALYAAKRGGRDRVEVGAGPPEPASGPALQPA